MTSILAERLQVHGQLTHDEIDELIEHWRPLETRMHSFEEGAVRLDLFVKDRDRPGQHVTLTAHIERIPPLVATAEGRELEPLLNQVRDEMIRLMTTARDRRFPRRHRR